MRIKPFALERYFAKHEFSVKHLLCSSDCDGMPMAELLDLANKAARAMWDNLALGYTESRGLPELRFEIAKLYTGIEADSVLVVAPEEGIFLTMNTLLEAGDNIVCASPGYQSLYEIAASIGCTVTKWEPNEADGWRFDPGDLRKSLTNKTKLVAVNFPHNPSGSLPSRQDFNEIINIVQENDLHLFSDEMYRHLEYDSSNRLPSATEVYDGALSLFGMSKTFGLAGLRIGWIIAKDADTLKKVASLKDYTTICPPAPSEILALIALQAKEKIIENNLKLIQQNLELADDFFEKYRHIFSWQRPAAGTIAFPKLLGNRSASKFCKRLIDEAELLLLPATVYDYGDSHIRFGFGRHSLPEALANLDQWLEHNKFDRKNSR